MTNNSSDTNLFKTFYISFFLILPLIFIPGIIDPILIPRQILLTLFSALIVILIISLKVKSDFTFLIKPLPLAILILTLIYGISIIVSVNKVEAFYVFSKYSILLVFYILTSVLLISKKLDINSIIKGIIIFNIVIVTISIYQIAALILGDQSFWGNIESINSSIANKNLLSSALFLTLPFLMCSYRLSKKWRDASIVFIIISLIIILLIQARAVWLSMFVFTVILWIYFLIAFKNKEDKILNKHYKKNLYFLTIFSSLIVFIGIYKLQQKQFQTEDLNVRKEKAFSHINNTRSIEARQLTWNKSMQMIKEYPTTGVGGGNWKVILPKYGLNGYSKGIQNGKMALERPHNDYLWVCCETGILGLIVFVAIFIIALASGYRVSGIGYQVISKKKSDTKNDNLLNVYLLAGLAGYMIISFFDFPSERIEHQVIFMTILAIFTSSDLRSTKYDVRFKSKYIILPIMLILIMFSGVVTFYRYNGLKITQKLYDSYKVQNWSEVGDEAKLAESLFYNIDPLAIPVRWYEGVAASAMNDNEAAAQCFEKSFEISPYNILVLNNLASTYEMQKDHKKAIIYYKEAIRIAPKFDDGLLNLSAVYFNIDEFEKAFKTIRKVKINSTNKNYFVFLNAILQKKIELIIKTQTDNNLILKLRELQKDKTKLINLFMESKNNNTDFEKYLLDNLK